MSGNTPAVFAGSAALFAVEDIERALAYYRDALGFRIDFRWGEPAIYAGIARDEVCIHLQTAALSPRAPGQGALNVFVTDVDALHAEFAARGARIVRPPQDYDYGMRDFDVLDPDGNDLCFGQATAGTEAGGHDGRDRG